MPRLCGDCVAARCNVLVLSGYFVRGCRCHQMLLASALAVRFQAHLPLTLGLVWLNNPLTLPLLIVAGYQAGVVILQQSAQPFVFEASWQWFASSLQQVGLPLLLGSVVLGIVSALLSWPLSTWIWRYRIKRRRAAQRQKWQQRRAS